MKKGELKNSIGGFVLAFAILMQTMPASISAMACSPENESVDYHEVDCLCDKYNFSEEDFYEFDTSEEYEEVETYESPYLPSQAVMSMAALNSEENACGDNVYYNVQDGVLTITGNGEMYNFNPGDTPWVSENVTKIVIEEGVASIGKNAFKELDITEVSISDTVTSIGISAFENCTSLISVTIPESVNTISHFAFYECQNLKEVVLSSSAIEMLKIENNAFSKSAVMNNDNNYAFFTTSSGEKILYKYTGNADTISIDDGISGICSYAFSNAKQANTGLTIAFSDLSSISSINRYSLKNCKINDILVDGKSVTLNDFEFTSVKFTTPTSNGQSFSGYTYEEKTINTQLMLAVFENRDYTCKLTNDYLQNALDQEIIPEIESIDATSDYVKVYVVYNWMRKNYEYAMFFEDTAVDVAHRWLSHYPEGMIVQKHGVCSSFSQMFNILMNKLNIECYYLVNNGIEEIVDGHSKTGAHGWNVIKVADKNVDDKYYYMDVANGYFMESIDGLSSNIFVGFDSPPNSYDRDEYLKKIKDYFWKVPYIDYDSDYDEQLKETNIVMNDSEGVAYHVYIDDQLDYDEYQYSFDEHLNAYTINDEDGLHYLICGEYKSLKPYLFDFDYEFSGKLLLKTKRDTINFTGSKFIQDELTANFEVKYELICNNNNKIFITITPEYHCDTVTVYLTNYTGTGVYYVVTMTRNGKIYQKTYDTDNVVYLLDPFTSIDFYFEDGTYLCGLDDLFSNDKNGIVSESKGGYYLSTRHDNESNYTIKCTLYELGDVTMNGIVDENDAITLLKYVVGRYNFIQTGSTGDLVLGNGNITVNGDISANGKFKLNAFNANINGRLSARTFEKNENGNINMNIPPDDITITQDYVTTVFSDERMGAVFFNGESVDVIPENHEVTANNINLSTDTIVEGNTVLNGNVNISSNLKSNGNINIKGNVENVNGSVIYTPNGDITLNSQNVNFNGFIYAPNGTVTIKGNNVTIKGTIIAKELIIEGDCVNFNVAAIDAGVGNGSGVGDMTLAEFQLMLGDMDRNNEIDIVDVIMINKKILNVA